MRSKKALMLLVVALFKPVAWIYFGLFWMAKFFTEIGFVQKVAAFFGQAYLLPWLFILQPLHILYIVISGFLGQAGSYEWKGRKLK